MYFCYIDESGDCGNYDATNLSQSGSPYFILIDEFAKIIGQYGAFNVISVVIDKSSTQIAQPDYLTHCIKNIYLAFDEFLKAKEEYGMLFFDRASEKNVTTYARKLMNTGSSGETVPNVRIGWIIEDPIFRISADSIFIQAADVIAYSLKEREFPTPSKKKFNADRIFKNNLSSRCYKSKISDEDGIIRA